jgi:outer membrane DcaP-like protein
MTLRGTVGRWMQSLAVAVLLCCGITPAAAQTPAAPPPDAPPPEAPAQDAPPREDGFRIGTFVFKPGGRIKLDVIRDFDPITGEDSFDPRTIVLDGSEGSNSQIHARETRLSLDMRGPIEGSELRMFVEFDFYGSGTVLRLRHAYGSYKGLLAGQTWSAFVDDANFPNTIDFESPIAFPQIRQAQARFTHKLGAQTTWAVAVEDNKSSIQPPEGVPGKAEYSMPDLTTRLRFEGSRGHVFGSAFLGRARFRPTGAEPDDVTLWGSLLSGRLKTFGRDYGYVQFTFGDGVGRYRGALTAVPDTNGELQPLGVVAFMGGYEHYWSDRLSSNAVYSVVSSADESYYAPTLNKQLDYGAVNLLYWFLPDRAWAGIEYLYGRRELVNGDAGTANRVQFAIRFNFPS